MTPPLKVESEEELKSLLMKMKEESEKFGLKLNWESYSVYRFLLYKCWQKNIQSYYYYQSFPGSSAGKESACNAGDPASIPG